MSIKPLNRNEVQIIVRKAMELKVFQAFGIHIVFVWTVEPWNQKLLRVSRSENAFSTHIFS